MPWFGRHLALREAVLRRSRPRVFVLHLGSPQQLAAAAAAAGEQVAWHSGCAAATDAADASLVISAGCGCGGPWARERSPFLGRPTALYVALLPSPHEAQPGGRCLGQLAGQFAGESVEPAPWRAQQPPGLAATLAALAAAAGLVSPLPADGQEAPQPAAVRAAAAAALGSFDLARPLLGRPLAPAPVSLFSCLSPLHARSRCGA